MFKVDIMVKCPARHASLGDAGRQMSSNHLYTIIADFKQINKFSARGLFQISLDFFHHLFDGKIRLNHKISGAKGFGTSIILVLTEVGQD